MLCIARSLGQGFGFYNTTIFWHKMNVGLIQKHLLFFKCDVESQGRIHRVCLGRANPHFLLPSPTLPPPITHPAKWGILHCSFITSRQPLCTVSGKESLIGSLCFRYTVCWLFSAVTHPFLFPQTNHRFFVPTKLLYFGILNPNNCGSLRRLHHSALLLILLYLPCPSISFTLNSKLFSFDNPFPL